MESARRYFVFFNKKEQTSPDFSIDVLSYGWDEVYTALTYPLRDRSNRSEAADLEAAYKRGMSLGASRREISIFVRNGGKGAKPFFVPRENHQVWNASIRQAAVPEFYPKIIGVKGGAIYAFGSNELKDGVATVFGVSEIAKVWMARPGLFEVKLIKGKMHSLDYLENRDDANRVFIYED